jgi:hypothetical protein
LAPQQLLQLLLLLLQEASLAQQPLNDSVQNWYVQAGRLQPSDRFEEQPPPALQRLESRSRLVAKNQQQHQQH